MPAPEVEEVPAPVVSVSAPPVLDVGFGNPQAVRIGLLVALLSFFIAVLSVQVAGQTVLLPICSLLGAGFISVYLYGRRTGQALTLRSGARMGWMTGLFAFVILLVLLTTVVLAVSDPGIASRLVDQMKARGTEGSADMMDVFRNPAAILQMLLISFVMFTLFPTLGGALGARLLRGRSR